MVLVVLSPPPPPQAYFMLDELLIGGEIQETSKKNILRAIAQQDLLQEESEANRSAIDELLGS